MDRCGSVPAVLKNRKERKNMGSGNLLAYAGEFPVFFPDKGAHAPGLSVGSTNAIRKLVIKVRK